MNDDSIDDLIAEQLSAGDQSERLGGLTDEELRILQGALERMQTGRKMLAPHPPEEAVQFAPEGRILAEELDESGEPTGNSRDYDMATGQERRTIRRSRYDNPDALKDMMRMRMDGAGAGPMPVQKYEDKLLPSIERIVREPMLKKLPKPALPQKTKTPPKCRFYLRNARTSRKKRRRKSLTTNRSAYVSLYLPGNIYPDGVTAHKSR